MFQLFEKTEDGWKFKGSYSNKPDARAAQSMISKLRPHILTKIQELEDIDAYDHRIGTSLRDYREQIAAKWH